MSDVRCQHRQIVQQRDGGAGDPPAQFVLLLPRRIVAWSVDQTKHTLNNNQKLKIFHEIIFQLFFCKDVLHGPFPTE